MSEVREPDLSFVIPGWSENRWSDLLAALIKTDPAPIERLVGVAPDDVRREVAVPGEMSRRSDRLDLLLTQGDRHVAAIEVKVLSDLGLDQLGRYSTAFPDAERRYVLHLASLPVDTTATPGWGELSWETVLAAYSTSEHPWVAATARAWLDQLDVLVPAVDAETVWSDVPDDARDFELALRARIAWLAHHLDDLTLERDLVQSTGGGSWVLRFWTDTAVPHLRVQVEVQEGMTAYQWRPDSGRRYRDRLKGPAPVVALRLSDVDTSESFDWDLLRRVFAEHVLDASGDPLPEALAAHASQPPPPRRPRSVERHGRGGRAEVAGQGLRDGGRDQGLPGVPLRRPDPDRAITDPGRDPRRAAPPGAAGSRDVGHRQRLRALA